MWFSAGAEPWSSVTGRPSRRRAAGFNGRRRAGPAVVGLPGVSGAADPVPPGVAGGRKRSVALAEFFVDAQRLGELVFQDDDAAGRFELGAGVDEFAGAGGQAQLVAREAAV